MQEFEESISLKPSGIESSLIFTQLGGMACVVLALVSILRYIHKTSCPSQFCSMLSDAK